MTSKPAVIVLMGATGSGKCSIINQLTGSKGDSSVYQKSHTQAITEFTFDFPKGRPCVLVNTPEFDDNYLSDRDMLCTVTEWLEKRYCQDVKLTGIIYTHCITNIRMSGSLWKNPDAFGQLFGGEAAERVRLVTTMWDKVKDASGAERRVSQLVGNFWKPLIDAGARHERFENTFESAWGIVRGLMGEGEASPWLQEELNETTAGKATYNRFQALQVDQFEVEQLTYSSRNADRNPTKPEGVPGKLVEPAHRYTTNLDGQIERGQSARYRGGNAVIYRGKLLADGRAVAVKTAHCGDDQQIMKRMLKEAHTWSKLKHPTVLSILGITTDFDLTVSLVSTWMEGGNANRYVQERDRDPRPLIKDIAQGLRYLHSYPQPQGPIIHGDLKGDNVLISSDGRAVLTDFGLSNLANSSFSSVNIHIGGTLRWMAPELISAEDIIATIESDIWAFGMTALELFTREVPYPNLTNSVAIQSRVVKKPPERPSEHATCSRMTDEWWDLCSHCLKMDPSSRIGMVDVVRQTRELPPRNDILIVVMGPTGSGKSNFVNKLTGSEEEPDANKLGASTKDAREVILDLACGKRYVFVDMPGFDNPHLSDGDILRKVADWLQHKYLKHIKVTGVIYTHRITDNHISGSVHENLAQFGRLCRQKAAQRVRLVTTMWDEAGHLEAELNWILDLKDLWKPPVSGDAYHERFVNRPQSALDIVNRLVGSGTPLTQEDVGGAEKQSKKIDTGEAVSDYPLWKSFLQKHAGKLAVLRVGLKPKQ